MTGALPLSQHLDSAASTVVLRKRATLEVTGVPSQLNTHTPSAAEDRMYYWGLGGCEVPFILQGYPLFLGSPREKDGESGENCKLTECKLECLPAPVWPEQSSEAGRL